MQSSTISTYIPLGVHRSIAGMQSQCEHKMHYVVSAPRSTLPVVSDTLHSSIHVFRIHNNNHNAHTEESDEQVSFTPYPIYVDE